MPDFASDREALWSAYRDWQDDIAEPDAVLGVEPGSWVAHDLRSAVHAFGTAVERHMRERVEAYADEVREHNKRQSDAGSKSRMEYSKQRAADEAEQAWWYWVKATVRMKVGVSAGSMGGTGEVGSGTAMQMGGTRYLVKPASFNSITDNDMSTDDIEMVTE